MLLVERNEDMIVKKEMSSKSSAFDGIFHGAPGAGMSFVGLNDVIRWTKKGLVMEEACEVVLQIFQNTSGQWGGRILRDGVEDGRVGGCSSAEDVQYQAQEAGIDFDRIEELDHVPTVE